MVFKRSFYPASQQNTWDDRFCRVEMSTSFKRITCPRCDLEAIYKYEVRQIRRRPEILVREGEGIRPDHVEMWKNIPRFAEIPEVLHCKGCKEVLNMEVLYLV